MESNAMTIATLSWPYRRFDALVSKKCKNDILIWLIIKLAIAMNKKYNRPENEWDDNNITFVRGFIAKNFKSRISDEMFNKAIDYINHGYISVERDDIGAEKREVLSDEAVKMSKNMQAVYTDDLGSLFIYQDLICGDVLPFTKNLKDFGSKTKGSEVLFADDVNGPYPTDASIEKAIEIANRIAKRIDASEFDLEDEDVVFDDSVEPSPSFKVNLVAEDKPVVGYIPVSLLISDGRIVAHSPALSANYDEWFSTRLREGRNINKELDSLLIELEKKYEIGKKIETEAETIHRPNGKKRELMYFSETYKIISQKLQYSADVQKYLELVVRMDGEAAAHNQNVYTDAGHLMTSFVEIFFEAAGDRPDSREYNETDFYHEVDTYFEMIGQSKTGCEDFKNRAIYKSFVNDGRFVRINGRNAHSSSSKSDFVDGIFLKVDDWQKCESMYKDFAHEFYSILGLRNKQGAHNLQLRTAIAQEDIEMINRVVNVFCDFYKQSINADNYR